MKPTKDSEKNRIYALFGLLLVFLLAVDFVLFATGTITLTKPENDTSTTEEVTTEDYSKYIDRETGFITLQNHVYYYPDGYPGEYYTGWYKKHGTTFYFGSDGILYTGWHDIEGNRYYFEEDGTLATSKWIDNYYLDKNGLILKSAMTPDHHYVDANGNKDDTVSIAHSKKGLWELQKTLTEMVEGYSGIWSVYVKNIDTNEYMVVHDEQQYTASLIKLFCAATIYDLADKGELEWDDNIEKLMTAMISVSDNDAFNLLVRKCDTENNNHIAGREVIQSYIDENGYQDTTITSALYPTAYPAPSSPGRNYTTTIDCGLILEKIYKQQVVNPQVSEAFLQLMLNQQRTEKIPAGLPEGTKCANKTGETDFTQHDAAIVYSPNATYIIVVMSTDCGAAIGNIRDISKVTYDYFNPGTKEDLTYKTLLRD